MKRPDIRDIEPGSLQFVRLGLTAQFTIGSDFFRDTHHASREAVKIVNHAVDGADEL